VVIGGLADRRGRGLRRGLRTTNNPKVVQERLGHSSVTVTLDIYSHVSPALESDAADRIARLMTGGVAD
jgi:integrase